MNRRKAVCLLVGVTATTHLFSEAGRAEDASERSNVQWVARVLTEMRRIRPGMTRADLLQVFTTEGGLSTGLRRTYVSRHCAFFKVDVAFQAAGRADKDPHGRVTMVEDERDQIATISRPYLAFSVMD